MPNGATLSSDRDVVFHVCSFTDYTDLRLTTQQGRTYRFEFSHRFGPRLLNKRGHDVDRLPGVRSERPFWDALKWWCRQSHRVVDGVCQYDAQTSRLWWSPDGRNFVLDTPENRVKFSDCVISGRECVQAFLGDW